MEDVWPQRSLTKQLSPDVVKRELSYTTCKDVLT